MATNARALLFWLWLCLISASILANDASNDKSETGAEEKSLTDYLDCIDATICQTLCKQEGGKIGCDTSEGECWCRCPGGTRTYVGECLFIEEGEICFSESATVQVQGRGAVPMKHLQVGDKVLIPSRKQKDDEETYEPVYAFAHYQTERTADFVQVDTNATDNNMPLELSSQHLVFQYKQGTSFPVRAESLTEGDELLLGQQDVAIVTRVHAIKKQGVYAPLTASGTLVVNKIATSCYISLLHDQGDKTSATQHDYNNPHFYAHMALAPFRLLCATNVNHRIVGSFCTTTTTRDGMPLYISLGLALRQWAHQQNDKIQWLIYWSIVISTGSCWLLELIVGKAALPMLLVICFAMCASFVYTLRNTLWPLLRGKRF